MTHDIIISGGGLVGATLALSLAQLPLAVVLIDPKAQAPAPAPDDRTFTLSLSSQRALSTLGVWHHIDPARATPIQRIHVSDHRGRFGFTHLDARELGVEALGYVTENTALLAALYQAMAVTGVTTLTGRYRTHTATAAGVAVTIDTAGGEHVVNGRLLVGADGTDSLVRHTAGIGWRRTDYHRQALVVNGTVDAPTANVAYERFTADGPVAALPAGDHRYTLVISQRNARHLMVSDDQSLHACLQGLFGNRLGIFTGSGRRLCFPLALQRARRPLARRTVVVGNAAQTLHPVAGQGFNLGLRDVATLADHIAGAVRGGTDPGADAVLAAYAQARRADTDRTIGFTDGLIRIFGIPGPWAALARNVALTGVDCLFPVKHALARRSMGLVGPLPRLLRGLNP